MFYVGVCVCVSGKYSNSLWPLWSLSPLPVSGLAGVSSLTQPLPASPPPQLALLAENAGRGRRGVVTEADALLEADTLLAGLLVERLLNHPGDLAQLLLHGHHPLLRLGGVDWAWGAEM